MTRRPLVATLFCAAALLAGGAVAVCVFIDREASAPELRPRIEAAASAWLGRPLTIDALEWRGWPDAVLVGRGVRLYEDPLKRRVLVDAPVVEARLAVLSVFKLAAGITELRFVRPRVFLRRDEAGAWNAGRLVAEIAARPDEPSRSWGRLAFNWFVIEDGTATVEDARGGLGALPPLEIAGRGKLRFGRLHEHFPFELSARPAGSSAAAELSGDLGHNATFRADVKDAEASLARVVWPRAERWTGRWNGGLQYSETAPQWRLGVRAASLVLSAAAPALDSLELNARFSSAEAWSFDGAARDSSTAVALRGSLDGRQIVLDVKSPRADADDVRAWARAFAEPADAASAKPARRLSAALRVDVLRCDGAEMRNVNALVSRSTGPYMLDRMSFESFGGSVAAQGSYLPSASTGALTISWRTFGVQAGDLFRWAGSTFPAGGVADSEGKVTTGVGALFLPALNGRIKLDVRSGWVVGMPGILKVLSRLNVVSLVSSSSGGSSRVSFDEMRGVVRIENGRASTEEPFVLENKTLQLAFMGSYDLKARTVDGKVAVNFLTVTDEIIRLIPGVRQILLGGEKGLIPIWLEVKGDADDPEMRVLAGRSIAGPVWNTLQHILGLPKQLIDAAKSP
jgi:hypothetical protein